MLFFVNANKIMGRRRIWRWGIPVAALTAIALVGTGALSASASPNLPDRTAAQLLADIEQSNVTGFSGQVVENAALGLPELPTLGGSGGSTSLTALLSGSHTARVWYAGPEKQRFALLGTLGETDIFHDGTDLWQWDSDTLTATHTTLPASDARKVPTPVASSTLTPDQLAQRAIAVIDPSTVVTTDQTRRIAGRSAYDLVLTPRDATSLIGSVRIGIDAQYKLPLSVQVFPRSDAAHAAFDVSFSSIDFSVPADSQFAFTPPKSAKVTQQTWGDLVAGDSASRSGGRAQQLQSAAADAQAATKVVGTGWTSVIELPAGTGTSLTSSPVFSFLTPASGTWGTGRLFTSKLVTALSVDNGPVFVGAVDPSVLYAAAGAK